MEIAVLASTPAEPPPTVVFSTPVPEETDVESAVIRVQFSRDMDAPVVQGSCPAQLPAVPAATASALEPAPTIFAFAYNVGARGIELKFAKPLERFQTVKVELLDGIKAVGGDPLQPWTPDIHHWTLTRGQAGYASC